MNSEKWKSHWRVFRSNKLALVGIGIIGFFLFIAIGAPLIAPFDPNDRIGLPFMKPGGQFWLGTNDLGQDIVSELIFGTRISLLIGILVAFISIGAGCFVGIVSGYYGGKIDIVLMRFVDVILAIPSLALMILLAAFLGSSFWTTIIVISMLSWAIPARIIRSQVLSLRTRQYVEAARSIGSSTGTILFRHILPGVLPITLSQFIYAISHAILIEASLSFLGLGDPLTKSWGTILYYAQARSAFLTGAWVWWILPPGLLITILLVGFAFTGYSLEEIFNPKLKKER